MDPQCRNGKQEMIKTGISVSNFNDITQRGSQQGALLSSGKHLAVYGDNLKYHDVGKDATSKGQRCS